MQLVKYFVIIISTAFLFTITGNWMLNRGLLKTGKDFFSRINAARDTSKNTNLLIIGSSRALVHLDTRALDSATGLTSYNYGLNKSSIKTCYNVIRTILNFQKNTKVVILNVDFHMFNITSDPYKDAYYYPYEKQVPGLIMDNSGTSYLVHRAGVFDIALYDDNMKYAGLDGWLHPKSIRFGTFNGYAPHTKLNDYEKVQIPASEKNIVFSKAGMNILNDCIELCKNKKVKLVLVIAPYYKADGPEKSYTNFTDVVQKVTDVAKLNNIPLFNYTNMDLVNNKKYFYNQNHLNVLGATIYTHAVADSLNKYKIAE